MAGRSQVSTLARLSFGLGSYAEGIKNGSFNFFLLFYYNQVLGLPGSLAGGALAIALIIDAITDPLVGSMSDRHRSRIGWGRRHPFMYGAAIPFAMVFYLLFVPPAGLSEAGLFTWLLVFAVASRFALTFYSVPHMTLAAELTSHYDERTVLAAFRSFLSIGGMVSVLVVGYAIFFEDGGQLQAVNYPPFALVCAVAMAVSIILSALGTHSYIPRLQQGAGNSPTFSTKGLISEVKVALELRAFRLLLLALIANAALNGLLLTLSTYVMPFYFQFEGIALGSILAVSLGGGIFGALICSPMTARFRSKRNGMILGMVWFAVIMSLPVNLRILGLFPDNGDPMLVPLMMAMNFTGGIGMGIVSVLTTAMVADVTDEHERVHRNRQEGIFYSAVSFVGKATSGLGAMLGGVAIDIVGLDPNSDAANVPEAAVQMLGLINGPGILVFAMLPVFLIWGYDIDRRRHKEILKEIAAARAAA